MLRPRPLWVPLALTLATVSLPLAASPADATTGQTLDLLGALRLAEVNDPNLAAVRSNRLASQTSSDVARAVLLPTLGLGGSVSRVNLQQPGFQPGAGDTNVTYTSTQYQAKLSQPVFHLDAFYYYQAAKAQYSQADAVAADQTQALLLAVSEAYFNVLRAEDALALAVAQEDSLDKQREQARARFNVGLVARTDVMDAEAQRDAAQARRLSAEVAVSNARETLNAALGTRIGQLARLRDTLTPQAPLPDDAEAWAGLARDRNPALIAARLGIASAEEVRKAHQASYLPTVDVFASYSDRDNGSSTVPAVVFNSGTQKIIGLEAQWLAFNGGRTAANVRQAGYQADAARQQAQAREHQIVNQARTGFLTVKADSSRLRATRHARDSAQLASDAVKAGYKVGTRNIVDVLLSDTNLFAVKREYTNARYDYVINTLRLHAAAGLLDEALITRLNGWLAH